MDKYTIKQAYPDMLNTCNEIEIVSDNLMYSELGLTYAGIQCLTSQNQHLIRQKCTLIADLIREINELNIKDE